MDKKFSVTITDFMSNGGEGYEIFSKSNIVLGKEFGMELIQIFINLIQNYSPLSPKLDNRSVSLSKFDPVYI
jgi:hypothetical protein